MTIGRFKYFPLVRTRQAELKALSHINWTKLPGVCPIVELTASRRTSKDKVGDIQKNLDALANGINLDRFILDVTLEPAFSNPQTVRLLDSTDAFQKWRAFLPNVTCKGLIPAIHIAEDMKPEDLRSEVESLAGNYESLAVRLDYSEPTNALYIHEILKVLNDPRRLCVIIDGGFIRKNRAADHESLFRSAIDATKVVGHEAPIFVTLSSSFPSSVVQRDYGRDHEGEFPLEEIVLTRLVQERESDAAVVHGDYATIHPIRYPEIYGGWVPRVDVPLKDEVFYFRYRREEGGYELAAKHVVEDRRYKSIGSWGNRQIEMAAAGEPEGLSPSHWIAVRVNIHIETQAQIRKAT